MVAVVADAVGVGDADAYADAVGVGDGDGDAGGGGYAPEGYQAAFAGMFATQAAGLAWFLLYRRAKV